MIGKKKRTRRFNPTETESLLVPRSEPGEAARQEEKTRRVLTIYTEGEIVDGKPE